MSMHRHSCLACGHGPTLSFAPAPAGPESCSEEDQEARSLHKHVSSATTGRSLPLVAMSTQKAPPLSQLHPCDLMHSGVYLHTHPHAPHTYLQHHVHKCIPSMHYQPIPEPLRILEVTTSNPNVHVGPAIQCSHADHVHRQPRPLALPAPTSKSLDPVPKPDVCAGSGLHALSKPFVNIDAQPLATYLSLAPICNKLAHSTMLSDDVRILDASSCGAPLCSKSALSCFHSGSEICHHQPPANASRAQICETHSRCIAPALDSSGKACLLPNPVDNAVLQRPGICQIPHPTFQAPPAKASNPTQPYVSMQENFKQPDLLAEMGPNVEDDFWMGATYDKPPTEGSLGRGRNTAESGWRGGPYAARGRGRNQGRWNSHRGNNGSGSGYAWKSTEEPNMAGNARSGTLRGNCGDKRKRESFNGGVNDWGSCKQTAFHESKPTGDGLGWGNPHGSSACNTNTCNGW